MKYLLLLTATLGVSVQDILRKRLDRRGTPPPGTAMALNLVISMTAMLFFVAAAGFRLTMHIATLPYALAFAAAYAVTMGASMLAVTAGPLSLTSLVMACSMLLPAVHGALFLKEPFGVSNLIGLIFLLCSLCFVCLDRKQRIAKRWYAYAVILLLSNGLCSIIQKMHQLQFSGGYKSEFMAFALAAAALVCLVCLLLRQRGGAGRALAYVWRGAVGIGVGNGLVNLLVMYLAVQLPAAMLYPAISGGSLLVSCLAARWMFQEALSRQRKFGIACGIIAVIIINL